MSKAISLLLALVAAAPIAAQSPSASVEAAAADIVRVRADRQPYTRYLSLYHVTDKKTLDQWDAVLRFWSNSLSREAGLVAPVRVAANLWRVDLGDYGWRAETWERLAEVEPYYTVKLITLVEAKPARTVREWWKGGINPADGKHYDAGWYNAQYPAVEAKRAAKAAFGPWLDAKAALALSSATQSQAPIVRLDWWLNEATVPNDRGTGYYDWLSLGTKQQDFLDLVGVDIEKARKSYREIGALVDESSVTNNNRAIDRFDAINGPYWRSRDFKDNKGAKNALRILDNDIKEDASEQYGTLPNRLFAFWLQNEAGVRQDTAPDFIASDSTAKTPDRRVKTGLSCVRCHIEGIRPIDDWARDVYQPPFKLGDRVYEAEKRKRAKYLSDLKDQVEEDQTRYAKALKRVNGLTPAANAKLVAELSYEYAVRKRSIGDFAIELGLEKEPLIEALKKEAAAVAVFDPVLAGLLRGRLVRVEHLEEVVPLVYDIWLRRGGKP